MRPSTITPLRQKKPQTIVLKIGGSVLEDGRATEATLRFVRTNAAHARVVLVHGGGPQIGALHDALGVAFEKRDGLRVTSDASMPIVTMVLRGLLNTRLVADLCASGVDALGVSGLDLGLLEAPLLDAGRLGRVGANPTVRTIAVERLLHRGADVLVVAPICRGADGQPVNVNADIVARVLATSLSADRLDLVTDVDGVRDQKRTLSDLTLEQARALVDSGEVSDGMAIKLREACDAVREGVPRVRIGDFASLRSGGGTVVRKSAPAASSPPSAPSRATA